jgi:hypothetical protein
MATFLAAVLGFLCITGPGEGSKRLLRVRTRRRNK